MTMNSPVMFEPLRLPSETKARIAAARPRLYRMAYAWCCDAALADDLAQETLIKALQKHDQLREPERLESWLYSILHNCWRTHLRQRRPESSLDDEIIPCDDCPETINQRQQTIDTVRSAIAALLLGQREVVTLVDLQGLAYAEVADLMNIPIGTVMSRLNRARKALQAALQELDRPRQRTSRLRRIK